MHAIGSGRTAPAFLSIFLTILGLFALLAVAFWLRWQYVLNVSLHVDEFTTLWAARRTLESGAPIMPSGVLYTRGILATYVTAAVASLLGLTYTVGRSPSVFFGLASIVAVLIIGRREWNSRVGWLAAVGLTLLPEAIVWGGRARFYSQLMFFALLTIWSAYLTVQKSDSSHKSDFSDHTASWRANLIFAALFALALFSQEETLLLYPPIVVGVLLWRGWRFFLRLPVVTAHLLCLAAMAARYAMEVLGQPGYFETIQTSKPYVGLFFDFADTWATYAGLFLPQRRLLWTVAVLLALAVALGSLWRGRRQTDSRHPASWLQSAARYHQATLYFALPFAFVLLVLLTVVGRSWRETRYLLMVQPCWLLIGAAGLVWLVDRLLTKPVWRWMATALLTMLLIALMWRPAVKASEKSAEGYRAAFEHVAANLQPGDVVITPQPPACAFVLGRPCDYYVAERSYESYVIGHGDQIVDRWSGAELLNTPQQLQALIQTAPRVWFVTDGERLARRFYLDFIRTVVEQFELDFEESDVRALLAEGWSAPPIYTARRVYEPPLDLGELALAELQHGEPIPGETLKTLLLWQQEHFVGQQINTSLQLVAADGTRITQADGAPARGMIATADFAPRVPDNKTLLLPDDLSEGRYRLEVITYDVATLTPATAPQPAAWLRIGEPPSTPELPLDAQWQDGIVLVGRDELPETLAPGEKLPVRLLWQSSASVSTDYTIFLHLLGPGGTIVAQSDRQPENGFYPTSAWVVGDPVSDIYTLDPSAALPAGEYRLLTGLYRSDTGERLLRSDGSDTVEIARWTVE